MRPYTDAPEFHAHLAVEPVWVEHYVESLRAFQRYYEQGVITLAQLDSEVRRLLVQGSPGADGTIRLSGESPESIGRVLARRTTSLVTDAPTVWVDPDVLAASLDVSEDIDLPPLEHLPFPHGAALMYGEVLPTTFLGEQVSTVGGLFYPVRLVDGHDSEVLDKVAMFSFIERRGRVQVDLSALRTLGAPLGLDENKGTSDVLTEAMAKAGVPLPGNLDLEQYERESAVTAATLAHLLRHLARDETAEDTAIAVVDAGHDRGAKRAARKRGREPEVNVIYLRRNARRLGLTGEGEGRRRRHRVRAHWRWQAYGPKHSLRRWVLVESYERGRGPLDERERVYVESD